MTLNEKVTKLQEKKKHKWTDISTNPKIISAQIDPEQWIRVKLVC